MLAELKQKVLLNNVSQMNRKILERKCECNYKIKNYSMQLEACREDLNRVISLLGESL
jgi:hypothetical protein